MVSYSSRPIYHLLIYRHTLLVIYHLLISSIAQLDPFWYMHLLQQQHRSNQITNVSHLIAHLIVDIENFAGPTRIDATLINQINTADVIKQTR